MVKLGNEIRSRIDKIDYDLLNVKSIYEEFKLSYLSNNHDKNEFDFIQDELSIFGEFLKANEITKVTELEPLKFAPEIIPFIPNQTIPDINDLLRKKIYSYYRVVELDSEEINELELFYRNQFASVFFDRSKRFLFFKVNCFDEEYFVDVEKGIQKKDRLYNYLLCQLKNKEDQIRFKGDFLDNLLELIGAQKHTKFKILLLELFDRIKEDKLPCQKEADQNKKIENNMIDYYSYTEKHKNPYPQIFTSYSAYYIFEKLQAEFGDTRENLANFSFLYHRMKKDELIFESYPQINFIFFLMDFNINITRIKTQSLIGNVAFKEEIYNRIKKF